MRIRGIGWLTIVAQLLAALPASAAVYVDLQPAQVTERPEGRQIEQSVSLANTVASYTLSYDAVHVADRNEITSSQWGWTQEYVPLGMTEPSQPNWYYQAFFNWYFDDESIYNRPATPRVVRESGEDGMIEYAWETPNASVSIRFAMVTGSDKLLMFGSYEPKQRVERSYLRLICYPSFFSEPRERAVTTALGTWRPGDTIDLDLEQERWVLYEDTGEGRAGQGPAGLILGTPDAFSSVQIPVGAYGIETRIELKPEARRFALALYDFPTMPDYRQVREYFGRLGDAEAEALGRMAAGDLDLPLGSMPHDEERLARILRAGEEMMERPAELWRPDPEPLEFPWAAQIPGEPIGAAVFVRRWAAWETMELARRLEMDVEHLYWDAEDKLSYPRAWPYAAATGIGAIPYGIAARKAAALASDDSRELFIVAGLHSRGVPGVVRTAIAQRVAEGKGLLLVGPQGWQNEWPDELFAEEAPDLAAMIMAPFDIETMAGLEPEGPGRLSGLPPVRAWRHGNGRVVLLQVDLEHFSSLMPTHHLSEGLLEAMDRWLGLCAQAALIAAGRELPVELSLTPKAGGERIGVQSLGAPEGSRLLLRIRDDLGRTLTHEWCARQVGGVTMPAEEIAPARRLPSSRRCFADVALVHEDGSTLGMASVSLPPVGGPRITGAELAPAVHTHELAPPLVDLPAGGEVECSATIEAPRRLDGAELVWEVYDAFGRLLATATSDVPAGGGEVTASLGLPRPVTVCHRLDTTLRQGGEELDFERLHFTMTVPYPYDDFTALMWNSATGSPLMLHTDRLCYEWGADMCDPANTLRADDERAARVYALRARSGLRMVPYVTRIHSQDPVDNMRRPSLSDPEYLSEWREWLTVQARQAAPYQPAAYTLGDENYLYRGRGEVGHHPAAIAEFRRWLQAKYETIDALNEVWGADYRSFEEIEPMLLGDVLDRPAGFAPWIDHKVFLDDCFANTHNLFREFIRAEDPDAKVGWDGILGYGWRSGYDFTKLTEECDLNQTYLGRWLQGRLVADFKRDDALVGSWGNRVADNEAGWSAFPWACLLRGDNSVWWWTSWGCDYVPFNPDLSQSKFGEWFYRAVRETTSGPGRMILHAERETSPIAVLYSKRNMFAATVAGRLVDNEPWASDHGFRAEHEAILKALFDLGYHPTHISEQQLASGVDPEQYRVLVLPLATCLSVAQEHALKNYVEAGGTLVVDGRAGILTADGALREDRAGIDYVLHTDSVAGREAFTAATATGELTVDAMLPGAARQVPLKLEGVPVRVLEPGLRAPAEPPLAQVDGAPVLIAHRDVSGMAIVFNIDMREYADRRATDGPKPRLEILDAIVRSAGVEPFAEIALRDGGRPLCTHQYMFREPTARYLGVQQDILVPGLADQPAHISLAEPAIVYDVRAGRRVGEGRVREWDVTLSRGNPLLYALLPYEVTGVSIQAPAVVDRGSAAEIRVEVAVAANFPGYHVVRLDLYAPGSDRPHRQYSQNVDCRPGGAGSADVPFALNDPVGRWRLIAREVASGVAEEGEIELR